MIVHESPDDAVKRYGQELLALRNRPHEKYWVGDHRLNAYEWALRHLFLDDLWALIRIALEWHWLDEELHGCKLMKFVYLKEESDKAIFLPRGHCKTNFFAARRVQQILRNPNIAIMVASATEQFSRDVGKLIADTLTDNDMLQSAFPDILPNKTQKSDVWGLKGYSLPNRRPRIDPTIVCASPGKNVVGKHPDLVWLDDLIVETNNTPVGYEKAEQFIRQCWMLLPPHGYYEATATRYNDQDPYSKIVTGEIIGKQGPFRTLVMSCYEGDNPRRQPIWPRRQRWNSEIHSGVTHKMLEEARKSMGVFFNAQMRNDPVPESEQVVDWKNMNIITDEMMEEFRFTPIRLVGLESLGGGKLILSALKEEAESLSVEMPLYDLTYPKERGLGKDIRLLRCLEPIVNGGFLWVRPWMRPVVDGKPDESDVSSFGYEIRRLGAARHDDLVDAFHHVPATLAPKLLPERNTPAHMYITTDLAWTQKDRHGDFSVVMAVAVTWEGNYWVVDYERFQLDSAHGIARRIISFFQRWNRGSGAPQFYKSQRRRSLATTYN